MRKLSNPLSKLWESDQNKSLWSILTKAWSTIRDQIGKDSAPLDEFFYLICPYVNVPSPEVYLEQSGWQLDFDKDGELTVSRPHSYQPDFINTVTTAAALSVEDIIRYCRSKGYAQHYVFDPNSTSSTFLSHSTATPAEGQPSQFAQRTRDDQRRERTIRSMALQESGMYNFFRGERENSTQALNEYGFNHNPLMANELMQQAYVDYLATHPAVQEDGSDEHPQGTAANNNDDANYSSEPGPFRTGANDSVTLPTFPPKN